MSLKHEVLWIIGIVAVGVAAKFFTPYFVEAIAYICFLGFGIYTELSPKRTSLFSGTKYIALIVVPVLWNLSLVSALDGQMFTQRLISLEIYILCVVMIFFFTERKTVTSYVLALVLLLGTMFVAGYRLEHFYSAFELQKKFNQEVREIETLPDEDPI